MLNWVSCLWWLGSLFASHRALGDVYEKKEVKQNKSPGDVFRLQKHRGQNGSVCVLLEYMVSHELCILNGQGLFNKSNCSCQTTGVTGTGFAPNCLIQQDTTTMQNLCCYLSCFRHWERGNNQQEERQRDSSQLHVWQCFSYVSRNLSEPLPRHSEQIIYSWNSSSPCLWNGEWVVSLCFLLSLILLLQLKLWCNCGSH